MSVKIEEGEFGRLPNPFEKSLYALEHERACNACREAGNQWAAKQQPPFSVFASSIKNQLVNEVEKVEKLATHSAYDEIKRTPPSIALKRAINVMAIFFTLIEVSIVAVSVLLSPQQTIVALVVGILLAGSAYLAGFGLGRALFSLFANRERGHESDPADTWLFGAGLFPIALVATGIMTGIRCEWGRDVDQLAFSVGFSALIVFLSALSEFLKCRYRSELHTYYIVERDLAGKRHLGDYEHSAAADVTNPPADSRLSWVHAFAEGAQRHQANHDRNPSSSSSSGNSSALVDDARSPQSDRSTEARLPQTDLGRSR